MSGVSYGDVKIHMLLASTRAAKDFGGSEAFFALPPLERVRLSVAAGKTFRGSKSAACQAVIEADYARRQAEAAA